MHSNTPIEAISPHLASDDDPQLWRAVLELLFSEIQMRPRRDRELRFIRIGACSHWLRPHQTRWTAAGGFAWPVGYGGGEGYSDDGTPEFDWSIKLREEPDGWLPVEKFAGKNKSIVEVAVPSRSARHQQAAVSVRYPDSPLAVFYGFRQKNGEWKCVAASDARKNGRIVNAV